MSFRILLEESCAQTRKASGMRIDKPNLLKLTAT